VKQGNIFLIPSALNENFPDVLPAYAKEIVHGLTFFIVENEKTARHYLRKIGYRKNFDEITMIALKNDDDFAGNIELKEKLLLEKNAGIISEAGMAGIADPGAAAIQWAHQQGFRIVPLIGPSSMFLALAASGLNGQQFAFHGYLPVKSDERKKKILQLEEESRRKNQTQIFMETPYRNNALLKDISEINGETLLCIASDITSVDELIQTKKIKEWKKSIPDLKNKPTIFLLLA
jgi:16S rRNA (cytidine1402-2'-O)-methyltransferase